MEDLSIEELNERMAALEAEKAELERLADEKRKAGKREFIAGLRDSIVTAGYDVAEIAEALVAGKRNGASNGKAANGWLYALNDEPALRYKGKGKLPGWMRDRMAMNGYDPSDATQRRRYIAENMTRLDS